MAIEGLPQQATPVSLHEQQSLQLCLIHHCRLPNMERFSPAKNVPRWGVRFSKGRLASPARDGLEK